MYSPRSFVNILNQPREGLIPLSLFSSKECFDGIFLDHNYSLYGDPLAHNVIKLITRYLLTGDMRKSFTEAIIGASLVRENEQCERCLNDVERALSGKKKFHRVNFKGITDATKLAAYAEIFESCRSNKKSNTMLKNPYKNYEFPQHKKDILKILIDRILAFLDTQNIIEVNPKFDGAYTGVISSGTTDFLTPTGIIDLQINPVPPNANQTLTSFINMRLMSQSNHRNKLIDHRVTLFNPCLNSIYTLRTDSVPVSRIIVVDKCIAGE